MVASNAFREKSSARNCPAGSLAFFGRNDECDFHGMQICGLFPSTGCTHCYYGSFFQDFHVPIQSCKPARGEAPTRKSIVRNEMEGYGAETIFSAMIDKPPSIHPPTGGLLRLRVYEWIYKEEHFYEFSTIL